MFSLYIASVITSLSNSLHCENLDLEKFYNIAATETRIVNENYNLYLNNLPLSVLPIDERKKSINKIYANCIKNTKREDFNLISNRLLHKYYTLTSNAYSITKNKDIFKNIIFILDEKKSRGENIDILADNARELAIQARYLKAAREVENRFKLTKYKLKLSLPVSPPEYSYYKISQDKAELTTYKFLEEDIIVISSPNCNPSKRFIDWYKSEGRFGVLKGKRVFFLLPQDVPMTSDTSIYNNLEYGFSYKDELWKDISYWATPTFYYLRDGNFINALDGWNKSEDGNKIDKLLSLDEPK